MAERGGRVTPEAPFARIGVLGLGLIGGSIAMAARARFPEIGAQPDAKTVFLKLRELRDKW